MNDIAIINFQNQNLNEIPKLNNAEIYELDLKNNNIKSFNYIPNGCISLNLTSNRISMIPKNLIKNFEIISLDLSHNLLISIQGIKNLIQLKNLNISNNYIPDDQLYNLHNTNIETLDLSNNNIKNKNEEVSNLIGNMHNLNSLKLNNNQLSSINLCNESKSLENLEIEFNKLKKFKVLVKLNNLKRLSLQNNELETIQNSENLSDLNELIINDNFINNSEFLKQMISLIKVNLNNNLLNKDISSENPNSNNINIYNIQQLEVTDNEIIEFIPVASFSNLIYLNLDNNKLSNLTINTDYLSLRVLKLNNNSIENTSFLSFLKNLSVCHIGFNIIKNAKQLYSNLSKLNSIKEIFIVENEFNKGLYNIDVLYENEFSSIDEYLLNIKTSNSNSKIDVLKRYRSDIIVNMSSTIKLDGIFISQEERINSKIYESKNTINSVQSKRESENNKSIKEMKNKNCQNSQNLLESKYFIREKKYAEDMYETLSSNGSALGNIIDKVTNIGKVNSIDSSKGEKDKMKLNARSIIGSIDHNEEIINYASKDFDLNILSKSKQLLNNQNIIKADKKKHKTNQSNDNSKYNLIEKRIDNDYHTTNENVSQFKEKKYNDHERRQYLKMNLILSENYDNENKNNTKNDESNRSNKSIRNSTKNEINTIKSKRSFKSDISTQAKKINEKNQVKRTNSRKLSEGSKLSTKNNPFKEIDSLNNINKISKEKYYDEINTLHDTSKRNLNKEKENSIMVNNDYKTTSIYTKKQEMWSKINSIKKEIDKEKNKIRNEIRESKILNKIKIEQNNIHSGYESSNIYIKKENKKSNKFENNTPAYQTDLSLINEKNTQISNFEDIKEKLASISNNTNFMIDNKSQASIKSLRSNKSSNNIRINSNGCKQFKNEDIDDLVDLLKSSEKAINIKNCYSFSTNEKIDFTINLLINSFWKINSKGFVKFSTLNELMNNLKEIYIESINEINYFLRLVEADILQSVNLKSIYIKDLIMILTLKDINNYRFEKMFIDIYNKYNNNLSKFEATTDIEDTSRIIYKNKKIDRTNTFKNRSISPSIGYNSSSNVDPIVNKSRINRNKIRISKQASNNISDLETSYINTGNNKKPSNTQDNLVENDNDFKNNDTSRFSSKILSKKTKTIKKAFEDLNLFDSRDFNFDDSNISSINNQIPNENEYIKIIQLVNKIFNCTYKIFILSKEEILSMYSNHESSKIFNIKNYINQIDQDSLKFKEIVQISKKQNSKINIKNIEIDGLLMFSLTESINNLKVKIIKFFLFSKQDIIQEVKYLSKNFFTNVMTIINNKNQNGTIEIFQNSSINENFDILNIIVVYVNLLIIQDSKSSIIMRIIRDYLSYTNDSSLVENVIALSNICKRDNIKIEIYKNNIDINDLDINNYNIGFFEFEARIDKNSCRFDENINKINNINDFEEYNKNKIDDNSLNLINKIESIFNSKILQSFNQDEQIHQIKTLSSKYNTSKKTDLLDNYNKLDFIKFKSDFNYTNNETNESKIKSNIYNKEVNECEITTNISNLLNENSKKVLTINMCIYNK